MKRGIALFLSLLVVTAAAVPGLLGLRLQQDYGRLLDELRSNGLQIIEHSYRRGWLSSRAVADLILPGNGSDELRWRVESRMRHSTPGRGFRLAAVRTLLLHQGGGPIIAIDSDLSWHGGIRSAMTLAASDRPLGEIRYQPETHRVETNLNLAELAIPIRKASQYSLSGLNFSSSSYLGAAGLRLGDMKLQLDGLDFIAPGQAGRRQLRGLYLSSEAKVDKGRVQVSSQWRIAVMGLGDLRLKRLEASLRLQGLSSVLLARTARVLPLFFLERPPPGGPELALAGTLLTNFTRLLESEPSLTLDRLRFSSPEGDLDAALHWRLRPPHPSLALDPDHWLRRLELQGNLNIGESVARRLIAYLGNEPVGSGWLDDLLRRGLLLKGRDDTLRSELRMRDGNLEINGRPVQLGTAE